MSKRSMNYPEPNQTKIDSYFASPSFKRLRPGGVAEDAQRKLPSSEPIDVDLFEADSQLPEEFAPASESKPKPSKPGGSSRAQLSFSQSLVSSVDSFVHVPISSDCVTFNPHPRSWTSIEVPYSFLAHTLSLVSQTRSRIIIINTLANTFRTIINHDASSLLPALYLLSNTLVPPYTTLELNVGPTLISRSIRQVSGLTPIAYRRLYNNLGDAGDVAYIAKSNLRTLVPHPPLSVTFVYKSLLAIAQCKGQGTAKNKQKIIEKLLIAATGEEVRFLVRTLSQNLRVGAVRTSILIALSRAMVLTPFSQIKPGLNDSAYHITAEVMNRVKPTVEKGKTVDSARDEIYSRFTLGENMVKRAYIQHPNYEDLVTTLLQHGLDGLKGRTLLTVGIPLYPTLGSPTRSLEDIYDILEDRPFSAEFKYDGQRAQIHGFIDGESVSVRIFSRQLEDMTDKYPDVVLLVKSFFRTFPQRESLIMDSEIVAIDPDSGCLLSFQELSNRARKDVDLSNVRITVCVFAFDLMYLDGEVLLEHTFRERRNLLRSNFPPLVPSQKQMARFDHVESCESEGGRNMMDAFWAKALNSRSEGLMIKLLDNETDAGINFEEGNSRRKPFLATYEPDKRTTAWLKLKRDYVTGLGDTLDLVPIGAWHGNGRKTGWWSPVLLALWTPETSQLVGICKCMSGLTDSFYKVLAERYQLSEYSGTSCSVQPRWDCDVGGFKPEVYFRPQEVWEIRAADITFSPVSVAAKGIVSMNRGLSLRFPRFIKVREDKSLEQANTPQELVRMWQAQQPDGPFQSGKDDGELVDVDVDTYPEESDEGEFRENLVSI